MADTIINIKDLTFNRGSRTILNNINITVPTGKIVAIMGPSGSGKTTLLRLMGGLLTPDKGEVSVKERNLAKLSTSDLYTLRKDMGLLYQQSALFTNFSVFENVAFPIREHTQLSNVMINHLVLMKLQAVGLRGAKELMPAELSGGMARRVALARAIALDPSIIMYDEPFAGLDPIALAVILKLIKELNSILKMTTIIVSHDLQETAAIADYIYLIAGGDIIGEGTPNKLLQDRNPRVKQFTHGLADGVVPFHYPAEEYSRDLGV